MPVVELLNCRIEGHKQKSIINLIVNSYLLLAPCTIYCFIISQNVFTGGVRISNLENVAGDFLALLAYMRDKFIRPFEQKTRSRLSHVQFFAVSLLHLKGSLSMSELAHEMQISKQQLSPLVYRLINQGLLVRKPDENDRRIVRMEVTEQGRKMVEELFEEIKLDLVAKLRTLPGMELDELEQMLKRIQEILENVE